MNARAVWLWGCVLALLAGGAGEALAQEQFVLVDSTFTMTAQNTMQSQYAIAPLPAAPESWKTPVDWSKGSMHVRFEILEKPSNVKTLTNVCFETARVLTCQPYPPPYNNRGVYESDDRLTTFWQYSVFDWTRKIDHVIVVIKDETGKIVQGNAMYYPSKMRVTVTIVPPGKTYKPSPVTEIDEDGGMPLTAPRADAGVAVRPSGLAAGSGAAGTPTPVAAMDAGVGRAGTPGSSNGAGRSALDTADAGSSRRITDYVDTGNSCALHAPSGAAPSRAALVVFGFALAALGMRRRRR